MAAQVEERVTLGRMRTPPDRLAVLGVPDLNEMPRHDLSVPTHAQSRPAGGEEAILEVRRFLQQGRRLVQKLQPMGRGRHGEGVGAGFDEGMAGDRRGRRMMLVITDAGLEAIGVDADETTSNRPTPTKMRAKSKKSRTAARQSTKRALLINLLKRKKGAATEMLVESLDWLPHDQGNYG